MRYAIVIMTLILMSGCATTDGAYKCEQNTTPEDSAKIVVKPNMDLPPPLDLDKYKIDVDKVRQYKDGDQLYIAIPEKDMINQEEFLLVLKTRIKELQRIIRDSQKLI